jgi:hypothetical protein
VNRTVEDGFVGADVSTYWNKCSQKDIDCPLCSWQFSSRGRSRFGYVLLARKESSKKRLAYCLGFAVYATKGHVLVSEQKNQHVGCSCQQVVSRTLQICKKLCYLFFSSHLPGLHTQCKAPNRSLLRVAVGVSMLVAVPWVNS